MAKEIKNKMQIEVLYEDAGIVVINKPFGIAVHADGKMTEHTIVDWVVEHYPSAVNVGEDIETGGISVIKKSGIVHRLDKDTTGALIICKTEKAYRKMKLQFMNHEIKKEYVAICYGWPKTDTGIINTPIARSKSDFRKKEIAINKKGGDTHRGEEREALTRYKVMNKKEIDGEKIAMIAFYPETGRMHQIRVHTKSIGHPIIGDILYGYKKVEFEDALYGKNKRRQLLHAKSIEFVNPSNRYEEGEKKEKQKVECKLPKDFTDIFN
jgi:23S rRNA pseudouridine1911/1915/1917 synthase